METDTHIDRRAEKLEFPAALLSNFNQPRKAGEPRTERQDLIQQFLNRLNPGRIADGLKPLSYSRLAKIFEVSSDNDIRDLFKECDQARSFSRLFWYKVNGPRV